MQLVDMDGPEPNWPKWFLVTHAMELAIKAFIVSREDANVPTPAGPKPPNHDLVALYDYAVLYGLTRDPKITTDLPHLSEPAARVPAGLRLPLPPPRRARSAFGAC